MTWTVDEDGKGSTRDDHEGEWLACTKWDAVLEATVEGAVELLVQLDDGMRFHEVRKDLLALVTIHERLLAKHEADGTADKCKMVSNNLGLIKGVLDLFDLPRGPHLTPPAHAIKANKERS